MHHIYIPTDTYQSIGMVNLTAFDVFTLLLGDEDAKPAFWDIHGFAAQIRFQLTPKYKITLEHFIYIPIDPYQSIGMNHLTAFDVFT